MNTNTSGKCVILSLQLLLLNSQSLSPTSKIRMNQRCSYMHEFKHLFNKNRVAQLIEKKITCTKLLKGVVYQTMLISK